MSANPASLREINLSTGYRTGVQDLIADFYVPCLSASTRYDRAAGYFRSTLYILVGVAMSDFAQRGGLTRLVCSPHLFLEDIDAIQEGLEGRLSANAIFQENLAKCADGAGDLPVVRLLASLVASRALDIRLAVRPGSAGIFHDKIGIFYDDSGNRVSFIGSANETYSAWHPEANHEGFEVFRDWSSDESRERVDRHVVEFERLWTGRELGIELYELDQISRDKLALLADPGGVDEAVRGVRHLVTARAQANRSDVEPGRIVLQPHQVDSLSRWAANGFRGILKHATGSGKTITALEAAREWLKGGRPVLVLVPSDLLATQWKREAEAYLRGTPFTLLQIGGSQGDPSWRDHLADATRSAGQLGPRLVIATIQTASSSEFLNRIKGGEHLLLVADEVHRLGAKIYGRVMGIEAGGRLGLSATPERYGDPDGTDRIMHYFGPILEPEFDLASAIRVGRLVPYDYFVHPVYLSSDEQSSWNELTRRIGVEYSRRGDSEEIASADSHLKLLLIQRARILKTAHGKVALAKAVLKENYEAGDRWLIYCDDTNQVNEILSSLRADGLPAFEYHSAMLGSKGATIDYFSQDGGIVVAIRCLDEGVDIPVVNKALVLASSTNPREFIQRRGRVLRKAADKYSAEIHDAVVLPAPQPGAGASEPSGIVTAELRRAAQFAQTARNSAVQFKLRALAAANNLILGRDANSSSELNEEGENQ